MPDSSTIATGRRASPTPTNWYVAQIGARQHYSVPRSFHRRGELALLLTEYWAGPATRAIGRVPGLRAAAHRRHPDLPDAKVCAFPLLTARHRLRRRVRGIGHGVTERYADHLWFGRRFGALVARELARRPLDPGRDAFFGFNTGCLETLAPLRDRGVLSVVDQIDPGRIEQEIVLAECERWPDWQSAQQRVPEAYWERLSAEWDAATRVLVNSRWSLDALAQQGVPASKMMVVPLAYEPPGPTPAPRPAPTGPLRVLWLGQVNLRKGIPYLFEAARRLADHAIEFTVAGPVMISEHAAAQAPPSVRLIGRVNRAEAADHYRRSHVFVLPTLSDGFAITQLEAMAHGLPVVTTPRCGRVVNHGHDGFVIPPRDPDALAQSLARLDENRALVAEMSRAALETVRRYGIEAYGERFAQALASDDPGS